VVSSISYTLGENVENLTLTGEEAINGTGNSMDNQITGNSLDNILDGGEAGTDQLIGGDGNDKYIIASNNVQVYENDGEGTDEVASSISYTLGDNVENLTLTGSESIDGTGNSIENVLTGNSLDNLLDGGQGKDMLVGGDGSDTYIVDNAQDDVVENTNEGTDIVQSTVSYELSANIENLTLLGSDSINGTGNTLDNVVVGNSGANTLDGAIGADDLQGGDGNDAYIVDNVNDSVAELSGQGTDIVYAAVNFTLDSNIENLTLSGTANLNATGNDIANNLTGNNGNNTIIGAGGLDTLTGGSGADVFVIGNATGNAYGINNSNSFALITDFTVGTDRLQLKGSLASDYMVNFADPTQVTITSTDATVGLVAKINATGTAADILNNAIFLS
jgi:Ca2+-binding RTX toxin-like protein